MDYATSRSESFDAATVDWIHLVLTVTRHEVITFIDGTQALDSEFDWPSGGSCNDLAIVPSCPELLNEYSCDTDLGTLTGSATAHTALARERLSAYCQSSCHQCKARSQTLADAMVRNQAYPFPSRLGPVNVRCMTSGSLPGMPNPDALVDCETRPDQSQLDQRFFESFDLRTDIFLGQRADGAAGTGFTGSLVGLKLYSSPLLRAEAKCLFKSSDAQLQAELARGGH